jgi:hypothetical protein
VTNCVTTTMAPGLQLRTELFRRAMHPIDNAVYSAQRSVATAIRSGRKGKARVWRHGNCPISRRTPPWSDSEWRLPYDHQA